MKKNELQGHVTEEGYVLRVRPRPVIEVSLKIPVEVESSLKRIAASRDMSVEALIKLYVGHGLREDLAKSFADRVLENTATVLARHLRREEVPAIMQEIRDATEQAFDPG